MNIFILDSWLKEYLKTKASAKEIAKYLSLCSQSVEKLTQINNDWLYEIEITTNRPDCFSVYGIARELSAILPRFDIPAKLQPLDINQQLTTINKNSLPLEVKINKSSLCPRFTALIFDNIVIKPSPKIVQERLEKSGIRAINNVVDISNYLMLELGQPMHTFDYDKIKGNKMILRESQGGEKITTLDEQTRTLPDGTMIIEDGKGRIIDLCGIMGGNNSQVDEKTKRVLLFIQTYDPVKIRQTCQKLAFRTDASSRFEKGVDPEGVLTAMKRAVKMFEKNCEAKIASQLIDIYPKPPKEKKVNLNFELIEKVIGIEIPKQQVLTILQSLGFSLITNHQLLITVTVPHWRYNDISIPHDLIEEIARIYGYEHLPNNLPPIANINQKNNYFKWEIKVKEALKFWGFIETISYSMLSGQMLKIIGVNPEDCIKIANPLSEEWVYMRQSLIPSLLEIAAKNKKEKIKIFEMANIYLNMGKNQLPQEILTLSILISGENFATIKGIFESIMEELGIKEYKLNTYTLQKTFYGKIFHPSHRAEINIQKKSLGIIGEIKKEINRQFGIEEKIFIFDIDFSELVKIAKEDKKYQPLPKYPPIIEDLSFTIPPKIYIEEIIKIIKSTSLTIKSVDLTDVYQDNKTFRITYQDRQKTLTDKEVQKIRKNVIDSLQEKLKVKLKDKKD
ncbi:MAG: phenylalanine--tRNA ligase subunit beta [Candidatus Shapirobacteria bacterium]|nr:phenylalanine--tRNA ligase subunit beta [Candidatus Shapirobacteria bacterium]